MSSERRPPRMRERVTVVVTEIRGPDSETPDSGATFSCRTADISTGGTRLSMETLLEQGTHVKATLIFKSPPAHYVFEGEVRWVKKSAEPGRFLTGIQFLGADENEKWKRFVEERFPSDGNLMN